MTEVVPHGISAHEKCIKQLAQNVEKNVRFHSNLPRVSQFIAKNAI